MSRQTRVLASSLLTVTLVLVSRTARAIDFRQLTFAASGVEAGCGLPDWSPDGRWIAYTGWNVTPPLYWLNSEIWGIGLDGNLYNPFECQRAVGGHDAFLNRNPSWSPDGARIAFEAGGDAIWIGSTSDSSATPLAGATGMAPDWSPDGGRLVLASNGIVVIPATGGTPQPLTANGAHPAWSADGHWIAFDSNRAGDNDVWIIAPTGGAPTPITAGMGNDSDPSWSPDGELIAFTSDRSGNSEIWVVRVATGALSQVTDDPAWDGEPAWSPDGSQLAFTSDRSGSANIWIASDLRTVHVEPTSWSRVKELYR